MWKVVPAILVCPFASSTGVVAAEPEGQLRAVSLRVSASQHLARMIQAEQTHPPIWRVQDTGAQSAEPERGWIEPPSGVVARLSERAVVQWLALFSGLFARRTVWGPPPREKT